ncbi:MAG: hypothetical protein HRF49_06655 [bacterium]
MEIEELSIGSLKTHAREWAERQVRFRCIMCGYVGRQHDFYDGSVACPNCADRGRYRQSFPVNVNYQPLLQSIHLLFHVPDENVKSMVVNLFVTAYELMFEELYAYHLLNIGVSGDLTDFIVDEARSFERKKRLFHALSRVYFDDAAEKIGEANTVARFEYFVRSRNMIIHRGDLTVNARAVEECFRLVEKLPAVFRKFNNEFFLWKRK